MTGTPRDYEHGLLPQADALAYGMTTALRRGFNGKRPRTRYSAPDRMEGTSPNVLITRADGSTEIRTASSFRVSRTNRAPRAATAAQQQRHSIMSWDLPAIGNND